MIDPFISSAMSDIMKTNNRGLMMLPWGVPTSRLNSFDLSPSISTIIFLFSRYEFTQRSILLPKPAFLSFTSSKSLSTKSKAALFYFLCYIHFSLSVGNMHLWGQRFQF